LVTPLRDGMNLVAKEFVACQINEPGVLILSPFAGAGISMFSYVCYGFFVKIYCSVFSYLFNYAVLQN